MASEPLTRQKAITWWIGLFVISVLGTAYVMWRWYYGRRLWLGVPLYAALFACSSVLGAHANSEDLRKSLGAGLRTLIVPAPLWALAVLIIELLTLVVGWGWFWRSPLPLALGVLSGCLWARQAPVVAPAAPKGEEAPAPMDFWKP